MIVVDGNDGTGKSTLVATLRGLGLSVRDRGMPTQASDDGLPPPHEWPRGERYVLLDAPVEVSQARLLGAGKSLDERYHNRTDLAFYRQRFAEVARGLGVPLIDASGDQRQTLARVLRHLGLRHPQLRVGLPKGRLQPALLERLQTRAGLDFSGLPPRQLTLDASGLRFYFLKPRSIAQLVALEYLDCGFCGRDLLMESGYDEELEVCCDLGMQRVEVCVGARDRTIVSRPPARPVAIATEFPLLASRWAYENNLSHIILASWGSTEAWVPDLADIVVDVVESGRTMEANGLTVLHTILESTTVLVHRRGGIGPHTQLAEALASGGET